MPNSSKQNSINIKMAQNIMFSLHLMKSILNSEHYLNIQYSKVFKYSYKHFFFSSNIQTCKIFYEYIFRVWTFVHVIFQEYKYIQTFVCVEIFTNITVPSTSLQKWSQPIVFGKLGSLFQAAVIRCFDDYHCVIHVL